MIIKKLILETKNIEAQRTFYIEKMGFKIIDAF
jgi:catechol-2,3-dioxygenase